MAQPSKTATQIITDFELQVNDITELSSSEELALLNRVYIKTCNGQPYEFLKKQASGTFSTDANGAFITLPSDFDFFPINNEYTDNSISVENNADAKVVFLLNGTAYVPYQVINFSDRRQYQNRTGFVYVDMANSLIRFTGGSGNIPPYTQYEFDYIKVPPLLAVGDYPLIPGKFHDMLTFKMATENDVLQLSPKAQSMQEENEEKYQEYVLDLQYWNSQFYNS